MITEAIDDNSIFSATTPAGREQRRPANAVIFALILVFIGIAPFARMALTPVWAFVPCYETVLAANNLITAVLLFGQFHRTSSRDLYLLACGFLFAGCLAIAHELAFPGLFTATGLLGGGPQTAPWLYMFWHASFPMFVIAYALMKDEQQASLPTKWRPRFAVSIGVAAALAGALALTLLATAASSFLPPLVNADQDNRAMMVVVSVVLGTGLFALAILWLRRPHFVLDLWMMVVMTSWIFDVTLSAALNAGRFDLGFYVGCVYGLFASSVMIMALPLENGRLYARLADAAEELRRLATTDALTGVANRRAFEKALDLEWRRAARRHLPLSLVMVDVDYFKTYNDRYGHVAGDECLTRIAGALAATTRRAGEMTARYGGEEFALLLPHADAAEALQIAERARAAIAALNIPHEQSAVAPHVTISVGVASMDAEAPRIIEARLAAGLVHLGATALVTAADEALYAAKKAGRNGACAYSADKAGLEGHGAGQDPATIAA